MDISAKIRALLGKTTAAGCTEDEAMAAALKARELMDRYGIDDPFEEQISPLLSRTNPVRKNLCAAAGAFCGCAVYASKGVITFHGRNSATIFAEWLTDQLEAFVQREAIKFGQSRPAGIKRSDLDDFLYLCSAAIAKRLRDLTVPNPDNDKAVAASMAAHGIELGKARANTRRVRCDQAWESAFSAAQKARFDKPVNQGARVPLIA